MQASKSYAKYKKICTPRFADFNCQQSVCLCIMCSANPISSRISASQTIWDLVVVSPLMRAQLCLSIHKQSVNNKAGRTKVFGVPTMYLHFFQLKECFLCTYFFGLHPHSSRYWIEECLKLSLRMLSLGTSSSYLCIDTCSGKEVFALTHCCNKSPLFQGYQPGIFSKLLNSQCQGVTDWPCCCLIDTEFLNSKMNFNARQEWFQKERVTANTCPGAYVAHNVGCKVYNTKFNSLLQH